MGDFETARCDSCNAPIIWAVTKNAKSMPVDVEPVKGGNVQLDARGGATPLASVLSIAQQFGKANLRRSHFVTCPNAAQHRRRRA